MTALAAIRDALAVYRLTKLVIDDEITSDLRDKVFEKFPPESTKIGYLFTCPWCVSIWIAAGLLVGKKIAPTAQENLSWVMAASAVTGLLEERR